jgi:hypothetical protein
MATFQTDDAEGKEGGGDDDSEKRTMVVLPGMTFGGEALQRRTVWDCSLVVQEPTVLAVLDGEAFRQVSRG